MKQALVEIWAKSLVAVRVVRMVQGQRSLTSFPHKTYDFQLDIYIQAMKIACHNGGFEEVDRPATRLMKRSSLLENCMGVCSQKTRQE